MSLTIQQLITDAKRLANRLKERDSVADKLLNETQSINKKIDAMKQYQWEVKALNEVANQKPHSQLIANIQKENRHWKEIQEENRELKAAIEEYQITLDHIMKKYRQHTTEQMFQSRINFAALHDEKYHDIIQEQTAKIQEMTEIMEEAVKIDDDRSEKEVELVSRLKYENRGLREMLDISRKFGSLQTEDKNIQTESST